MPASACAESEGRMRPMIDEQEFRKLADDALNALNRNLIALDRKSTRLNSSHLVISYAVFCLKKKNTLRTYISNSASMISVVRRSAISVPSCPGSAAEQPTPSHKCAC